MEVTITSIREVLDGVESNLKTALRESKAGMDTFRIDNIPHLMLALGKVQEAITELILVR